MNVLEYLKNNVLYLDGGMGTLLQKEGLPVGELPERWNISHPEVICDIHARYYNAGSNVVCANTFGANPFKFDDDELCEIIKAAVLNANLARKKCDNGNEKFVALDVGPLGRLLAPYGQLDFEEAVSAFAKIINIGKNTDVDLIIIETMNDSYETKAALLAAKENCNLPVFVSNAYAEDEKLITGANPQAMVAMLEGLGADAIGINCSLGPKQLKGVVSDYLKYSSLPILLKPNAGLPRIENKKTVYDVKPDEFSDDMREYIEKGVRIAGGCCGTSPEYIKALVDKTSDLKPVETVEKTDTIISSYTHAITLGNEPILIGERINPTGKKKFKEALINDDLNYILELGIAQQEAGVHVLDVNVGLPEIDEVEMMKKVSTSLQAILTLPLQIDTVNPEAMEMALRRYNGKAMINSTNGKKEEMEKIFPLAKKYGGVVVCLLLDEDGIPQTVEKRIEIARKIIDTAKKYGIKKKDLIFDPLAMTISADTKSAIVTLDSIHRIKNELNSSTLVGVSNVSFGLPSREAIAQSFFTMALHAGLGAAIMNPNSKAMMRAYYSFMALNDMDPNCESYIENIVKFQESVGEISAKTDTASPKASDMKTPESDLQRAIVKGLSAKANAYTLNMINEGIEPLEIVKEHIIPALDIVGVGFEKGIMFLPQLLMSADSAKASFEEIKKKVRAGGKLADDRGKFILATVEGDIHDIGKNIVSLILENYGFEVIDIGKDVSAETILETVLRENAPFVGLSALMTTTVPSMEEAIALLKEKAPKVKVVVGGAVLTQEYADSIGADYYAKDAMATVRYALKESENENN